MTKRFFIKTTKAQKQAWMLAEEGSYEDSGKARYHAYERIRGSYWANIYVDDTNKCSDIEPIVKSFVSCTFYDQNPRMWKALAPKIVEACESLGRDDLAKTVREYISQNNF